MRLDRGRPTSDHFMEGVEFKNSQGKTMRDVAERAGTLKRGN